MPPRAPRNLRYDEMIRPGWPAGLQSPAGSIHEPPQTSRGETPGADAPVTPSSPKASLPSARPAEPFDPEASRVPQHCPPPALAGARRGTLGCSRPESSLLSHRLPKQVTLSTLSRPRFGLSHFYLRVHPEKQGGKNPEEIRVNWKEKNFKRVSTAAKKPRLCRPSNDNKAFRRALGDCFPPRSDQKPGTLGHFPPLAGRENSTLPPAAPFLALGKHSGP
ncbi:uncharacterized protein LOC129548938 [Moschus berezovskii]|uniref:uncharacterized protein LOC129548938 n=1 Tax=Moschus berezovskii TaxID=68408 RepID=UPI002444756F|nr:uncharacterized protein LOC129548938 [Moschus berezovskii]